MSSISGKSAVFVLFMAFLLAVSVGGVFASSMMNDTAAFNCPFMGTPTLCAMNPLQHLSEWQQTFATIVQQVATNTLLLLVLCAALFFLVRPRLLELRTAKGYLYRSPPFTAQSKKITGWLSLFEQSPSQI